MLITKIVGGHEKTIDNNFKYSDNFNNSEFSKTIGNTNTNETNISTDKIIKPQRFFKILLLQGRQTLYKKP